MFSATTETMGDHSPSFHERRKRPLSMVLEENHDDDDDENKEEGERNDKDNNSDEEEEHKLSSPDDTKADKEQRRSDEFPNNTEDCSFSSVAKDNADTETASTLVVKKTRRVGISYHQPPSFTPHDHSPLHSPNHTPRTQRRLFEFTPPSQRKISENTLRLRRKIPDSYSSCYSESTDSESDGDCVVSRLKDTATKLNLKTRRQSYLTWRAKYVEEPRDLSKVKVVAAAEADGKLTKERKDKMDGDLKWIRQQLVDLRRQDRSLAQQLLSIRHELSSLRLAVSCEEHRELLEDAQDQVDDLRALSRFVDDLPLSLHLLQDMPGDGHCPLRHIGLTKMNLSSRRFSTC